MVLTDFVKTLHYSTCNKQHILKTRQNNIFIDKEIGKCYVVKAYTLGV
jgi:hypothetical protein